MTAARRGSYGWYGAIALIAAAGCQRGGGGDHGATRAATRIETVHSGRVADRITLTGEIHAVSSDDLHTPRTEAWELNIRWLAEDGAAVKAGDRVVEFDNAAVASKLEEAKLQLIEAEMAYANARQIVELETATKLAELEQHKIALAKAVLRAQVPADLLTARDAQERQLEKKRAEVAVKKAEGDLAAQRSQSALDLQVKQIELDKSKRSIEAAERTIDELSLKAPKDGVVVIGEDWEGRKFHTGGSTQPGMTVASIPDLSAGYEVQSDLSDVDDGRIALGVRGRCTLDAYPDTPIACAVASLTPIARSKGEKSLRRAFNVRISLAGGQLDHMRPGMSVKAELPVGAPAEGLVVPRGALVDERPAAGKPARARTPSGDRDVELGPCDALGCIVRGGLAAGDRVVIGGGA